MARTAVDRVTAGAIDRFISQWFREVDWSLRIPGQHGGGVSNQDILQFRIDEGRDFTADTTALRRFVKAELQSDFDQKGRIPNLLELKAACGRAILAYVVRRINYEVRDVRIPLLTLKYQESKRKAGYLGPVGVRTGKWLEAVERAKVILST